MMIASGVKSTWWSMLNGLLGAVNLKVVRKHHGLQAYIPFDEILKRARDAALSVGDYVETAYDIRGSSQATIECLNELRVYAKRPKRICEIGPGSGRYLEKTIQICHPDHYEIYETAPKRQKWLTENYHVTARPTDGRTLCQTLSHSINLVQAHKELSAAVPFMDTCSYFLEVIRIIQHRGVIVFDVVTEGCVGHGVMEELIVQGNDWPVSMMAESYVLDFFGSRSARFLGTFFTSMKLAKTEYFVFEADGYRLAG